ncbi:UNKNOWN [Stylonychia lemnae]|uniref:Hexose transporter 1 n=1 Tax=Stylonychia lemnae TaxID=5949 RepID=A0A078ARA9_STYLE|nr:UNKNOWN [Stylonychia lemnae]|eukprot:CDW83378.1 UNKNOWN [Stylonychia lemnae]
MISDYLIYLGLIAGYGGGIVAGTGLYIHEIFPEITIHDKQVIFNKRHQFQRFVSLAIISASIMAFFSGQIANKLGRKMSIIIADMFFVIGNLTIALAPTINFLIIGRFIVGFGLGLGTTISLVYVAECSPNKLRGTMLSFSVLCVFAGNMLSYTSCILLGFDHFLIFTFILIPTIAQLILITFFQSDTPIFYVMMNKKDLAEKAIKTYYNNSKEGQEESQIQMYKELFSEYKWNLFVGLMLNILQQLSGVSLINYYGPKILKDAGFASNTREGLMCSMIFLMAFNFTVAKWLSLNHLRGTANSLTGTSNWLGNYSLAGIFLQITQTQTGKIFTYSLLAFNCMVMFFFVWRFVPETKDKSIDECVKLIHHSWKSKAIRDKINQKEGGLLDNQDHIQLIQTYDQEKLLNENLEINEVNSGNRHSDSKKV